jgi:release factor glutamine methyltransferase
MASRRDLLLDWERHFVRCRVDSPRLSAQVLLAHVLGVDRLVMLLDLALPVSDSSRLNFENLATRRAHGEPVAYLVGRREFYGLEFVVSPDVLIPRPETEMLIDLVRDRYATDEVFSVLDIGTGCGALAITCASLFPRARVIAVDISRPALRVAHVNVMRLGVGERVGFVQADLSSAVRVDSFAVILANLPYVPLSALEDISVEVCGFEPHLALFSGDDGLDCYRRLVREIAGRVRPGTILLCEIDPSQDVELRRLFLPWAARVDLVQDYSGANRVLVVVF